MTMCCTPMALNSHPPVCALFCCAAYSCSRREKKAHSKRVAYDELINTLLCKCKDINTWLVLLCRNASANDWLEVNRLRTPFELTWNPSEVFAQRVSCVWIASAARITHWRLQTPAARFRFKYATRPERSWHCRSRGWVQELCLHSARQRHSCRIRTRDSRVAAPAGGTSTRVALSPQTSRPRDSSIPRESAACR